MICKGFGAGVVNANTATVSFFFFFLAATKPATVPPNSPFPHLALNKELEWLNHSQSCLHQNYNHLYCLEQPVLESALYNSDSHQRLQVFQCITL